ncbi:unnamed protein product [Ectocarpus sp. 12 AP-2014]
MRAWVKDLRVQVGAAGAGRVPFAPKVAGAGSVRRSSETMAQRNCTTPKGLCRRSASRKPCRCWSSARRPRKGQYHREIGSDQAQGCFWTAGGLCWRSPSRKPCRCWCSARRPRKGQCHREIGSDQAQGCFWSLMLVNGNWVWKEGSRIYLFYSFHCRRPGCCCECCCLTRARCLGSTLDLSLRTSVKTI